MFSKSILSRLLAVILLAPLVASATPFVDVLDTPSRPSRLTAKGLINALASAGNRLVGVGQRGHIVYSDDAGKSWQQASVPVSSDLVAVQFPSAQSGWAVGHDGVVLHTTDGGKHWEKQFDGRMAGPLLTAYYAKLRDDGALGADDLAKHLLEEISVLARQGAENPLLDVWFDDENNGFVVGAFNLIYRTRDGGKSWEPWFHRTDNPRRLHLYAIRRLDAGLFIVGEQGLVMKLGPAGERFVALDTSYRGTYFGVTGKGAATVAFGLRGNVFRSTDGGTRWQKVETGLPDGVTAAAHCPNGRLILASQSGSLLVSADLGAHFSPLKLDEPVPAAAVECDAVGRVVIAGPRGIRVQPIHQ